MKKQQLFKYHCQEQNRPFTHSLHLFKNKYSMPVNNFVLFIFYAIKSRLSNATVCFQPGRIHKPALYGNADRNVLQAVEKHMYRNAFSASLINKKSESRNRIFKVLNSPEIRPIQFSRLPYIFRREIIRPIQVLS